MSDVSRIEQIFLNAASLSNPADREAYLDSQCGSDADLRRRVEALLAAQPQAQGFLEPVTGDRTSEYQPKPESQGVGTVIADRYTLTEIIGEGGMGTVWRAKQTEPVKRFVALKLIKPGMDSKQVLARFEAERQALAMMDHPNIAKILDGGIHDNRPFFVMELVKGTPITEFCDARKLTPRQRLELFLPVCLAIQHAHQMGIIHRDIKPSNVLIALYDDKPVPKVIDFGVAKATGGALTQYTIDTGFGGVVGTPQYMSPEQATFNNLDIDTRSDVYSLGTLLYELLAGSPPFARPELEKRGLLEILRVVREEEPPRPSLKLSTAEAKASISANRSSEPAKLSDLMRGEIDWIVMKALEKDRSRRYETANDFAFDVQRYLSGEPVLAVPPSLGYRLKKAYRKNRVIVLASVGFSLSLLLITASLAYILSEAGKKVQLQALLELADVERADAVQARETLARAEYCRTIGLSDREYLAGRHGWAQELLDNCSKEYRGWEWQYLARKFHPEELCLQHRAGVSSATINPEGTLVATASVDGIIRLWDTTTGHLLRKIEPNDPMSNTVVFTPDGSSLVTSHYKSARLWRVSDGKEMLRLLHEDTVFAAAVNSTGSQIATSCQDRIIRVWDAASGKELLKVDRYKRSGGSIQFSPDNRMLVFGNGADPLAVIDAVNGAELFKLKPTSQYAISPRFSPDGKQLAFSAGDHVNGYEIGPGFQKQTVWLESGRARIDDFAWTSSGAQIFTVDDRNSIHLWDVKTREKIASFRGHAGNVNSLALSRDGNMLVTSSGDGTARIWNTHRLPRNHILRPLTGVHSLGLSHDGSRAVIGGKGEVQVWDLITGKRLWTQPHGVKWIARVSFSPDGQKVVSGGDDHTIVLWDSKSGTKLVESSLNAESFRFLAFHPKENVIVTNGSGGTLQLLSADSLKSLKTITHPADSVWSAVFSPDGHRFATSAEGDGIIRIWDTVTWTLTGKLEGRTPRLNSICFSADGKRLACRAIGGEVLVFDVPGSRQIQVLPCPRLDGVSMAFSPDGTRVAASGESGEIHVWEVESGSELLQLTFHESVYLLNTEPSKAYPMVFSHDGKTLVTGAFDQSIRVWDGTPLVQMPPGVTKVNVRK